MGGLPWVAMAKWDCDPHCHLGIASSDSAQRKHLHLDSASLVSIQRPPHIHVTPFQQATFITLRVLWGALRISEGPDFCIVESVPKMSFGSHFSWCTNHLSILEIYGPKRCDLDHMVCSGLNMSGSVLMRCGVVWCEDVGKQLEQNHSFSLSEESFSVTDINSGITISDVLDSEKSPPITNTLPSPSNDAV